MNYLRLKKETSKSSYTKCLLFIKLFTNHHASIPVKLLFSITIGRCNSYVLLLICLETTVKICSNIVLE